MDRRVARIEISPELLVKHLHMPDDTAILHTEMVRGVHGMAVALIVEHEDLPQVEEGVLAPTISPIITYHRESWDFDWNASVDHPLQMDDEPYPDPLEYDDISWTPEDADPYGEIDPLSHIDPYGDTP